jgi:hypothetical protein
MAMPMNTVLHFLHQQGKLLAVLLLAFCCIACTRLKTEEPPAEAFDEAPQALLSHIAAPIAIPLSTIEAKINQSLSETLVNDERYEGNNLKIKVKRKGPIQLSVHEQKIHIKAPLHVWVDGRLQTRLLGKSISKTQALQFAVHIHLASKVDINPQWQLVSSTSFQSLEWIEEPHLKLGPVDIPLTNMVEKAIMQQMPAVLSKLDEAVRHAVKLDKAALKIWTDLQKPILVHKKHHQVWLLARPVDFSADRIRLYKKYAIVNARIGAFVSSITGEKPRVAVQQALPPLQKSRYIGSDSELNALAAIPYESFNQVLEEQLQGKAIELQGHKVVVKKVSVYGNGRHLVFRCDLRGDVKGTVYLKGRPAYDSARQRLYAADLDYDIITETALLQAADWLLHDTFREQIQQIAVLPLEESLQKLPGLIEQAVAQSNAGSKISLRLDSMQVAPVAIAVRPQELNLLIRLQTKVNLQLHKL